MDKKEDKDRNLHNEELEKELGENKAYKEYVEENGAKYRVPYQTVKEVIFSNLNKEELIDMEHAARLQYRLLLLEAVIRADVEFVAKRISVTYNPKDAENRREKISREEIISFLAKQGVHVSEKDAEEKEMDYYRDIYSYQYDPPSIREHPPYGYTPEEWKKMKADYEERKALWEKQNKEKFHEWQKDYLQKHPELAAELK